MKMRLDGRSPTIEGVKKRIANLQRGACDLKILLHHAAEWVSPPLVVSVSGNLMKALEVGVGRHQPGKRFLDHVSGIHRLSSNMRLWRRGCYDSSVNGTDRWMSKCGMKASELGRDVADRCKPRTMMFAVVRDTDSRLEQSQNINDNLPDASWRSWSIVIVMGPNEEVIGGRNDATDLIREIISAASQADVVLEFKMNQAMVFRGADEIGIVPEMDDSITVGGRGSASMKVFHRNVTLVSTHFYSAGRRITDIVMYQPMLLRVLRDLLVKVANKPWKYTEGKKRDAIVFPKKLRKIVACCVELSLTVPWMGTFFLKMLER